MIPAVVAIPRRQISSRPCGDTGQQIGAGRLRVELGGGQSRGHDGDPSMQDRRIVRVVVVTGMGQHAVNPRGMMGGHAQIRVPQISACGAPPHSVTNATVSATPGAVGPAVAQANVSSRFVPRRRPRSPGARSSPRSPAANAANSCANST